MGSISNEASLLLFKLIMSDLNDTVQT